MNSNKLSTLLAQDIPDPTDFPKEASSLAHLDTAVRCQICSNFLDGPVTLSCGHCFCSVVRTHTYTSFYRSFPTPVYYLVHKRLYGVRDVEGAVSHVQAEHD